MKNVDFILFKEKLFLHMNTIRINQALTNTALNIILPIIRQGRKWETRIVI